MLLDSSLAGVERSCGCGEVAGKILKPENTDSKVPERRSKSAPKVYGDLTVDDAVEMVVVVVLLVVVVILAVEVVVIAVDGESFGTEVETSGKDGVVVVNVRSVKSDVKGDSGGMSGKKYFAVLAVFGWDGCSFNGDKEDGC